MDEFIHVYIHHGSLFVDDDFSNYEGLVSDLRCDIDKLIYFEVVEIIKDLGYKEFRAIL